MEARTARWAQLSYLDREDIEGLHQQEVLLATRSGPSRMPLFSQKGLGTWEATTKISQMTARMSPDGFFPNMDNAAQYRAMSDFEKAVYPIWRGIEERDSANEAKLSMTEINKIPVMLECLTVHRQDLAIHASGHKPSRLNATPEAAQNLRKKAAAGEKYGAWAGAE